MHYIVKCEKCDKVIEQCRCASKDKITTYEICRECEKKGVVEKKNATIS